MLFSLSLSLFLLFVCSHSSLEGVTSFPDNFPLHQKDRRFYSIYIKRFCNKNNLAFSLNGEAIWKSNNSHLTKGEALDIDHRITKQQYTPLFSLNGTWVVERPVVWHANKKTILFQEIQSLSLSLYILSFVSFLSFLRLTFCSSPGPSILWAK